MVERKTNEKSWFNIIANRFYHAICCNSQGLVEKYKKLICCKREPRLHFILKMKPQSNFSGLQWDVNQDKALSAGWASSNSLQGCVESKCVLSTYIFSVLYLVRTYSLPLSQLFPSMAFIFQIIAVRLNDCIWIYLRLCSGF